MAHAMELPAECDILKSHPVLTYRSGPYSYRIERQGEASTYSVSDGAQTISVPIGWAFGLGLAGQTYVYEYKGELYQSRVSYYKALDGLDRHTRRAKYQANESGAGSRSTHVAR